MRVFRATYKDKAGLKRQAAKWYVEFRDHLERIRRVPGFTDKGQTEELGRKLLKLVAARANTEAPDLSMSRWLESLPQRIRAKLVEIGLLEGRTVAATKPLVEHLTDFQQHLRAKGATVKHVHMVHQRARDLFEGCGFRHWSDVHVAAVERWLAELMTTPRKTAVVQTTGQSKGRSVQSRNFYLQAAKQFCRWMVRDGRAATNPLDYIGMLNVATDRRHDRRALSIDELKRLLATTVGNGDRFGVPAAERALLYRFAAETGLRASELRSLTRASFRFGRNLATVTVEAGTSKRRRRDELPIRPDTAESLRALLATKLPKAEAFTVPSSDETANMLRADLQASRDAWLNEATTFEERAERERSPFLTPVDEAGQHVDFHALRHTFLTNLARSGVQPATAQRLAHHSDVRLTLGRYTHVDLGEQYEALKLLPDLSDAPRESSRATGTDGKSSEGSLAFCLAPNGSFSSTAVQSGATNEMKGAQCPISKKTRENPAAAAFHGANEEVHPRGLEPLTFGSVDRCSIQLS